MGDTIEASSNAAQRAQPKKTSIRPGFLARVFGNSGTGPKPETSAPNQQPVARNGHAMAPIGGISNLNRMRVEDVAVPKAEMVTVRLGIKLDELVKVFRESGKTRLPVFQDTLDKPVGFIHLKDLALKFGFNGGGGRLNLRQMVRELLFAPPSMPIGVLLQKMQSERIHMALVIDEYGGVDGLVTIEDLIEQVVGEIEDEHDVEEVENWSLEKPGIYLAQSRTPLDEFEAEIGRSLIDDPEDDEVETLGGLVFVLAGRVPLRGEVIKHPSGLEFEIIDADPRRIKRLRVCLPEAPSS